jgi:hypothetical protein
MVLSSGFYERFDISSRVLAAKVAWFSRAERLFLAVRVDQGH